MFCCKGQSYGADRRPSPFQADQYGTALRSLINRYGNLRVYQLSLLHWKESSEDLPALNFPKVEDIFALKVPIYTENLRFILQMNSDFGI